MKREIVEKLAIDVCIKENGHIPQLIVCGKRQSSIMILKHFPDTYEEKIKTMASAAIQTVIEQGEKIGELRRVFFISEAWMSVVKKKNLKTFLMPSKDPNRIEVLIISEFDVDNNEENVSSFEIKRNSENRIYNLERMKMGKGTGETKSALLQSFIKAYYFAVLKKNELKSVVNEKIIIN